MVKTKKKKKISTRKELEKLHIALCQHGADLEKNVKKLIPNANLVIHKFDDPSQLYEHNQRSYIDLAVFVSGLDYSWISDMVRRIKAQSTLHFIPMLVYAPDADKNMIISCLREGVDEIMVDPWDHELLSAKAEMLILRSQRDLSVNPSTKLPGPNAIEYEIDRKLQLGEMFAVCYADIDNFKAYNDYHGYVFGDKMIKITSHIVRSVVQDLVPNGFVGHIGGDDFIFIIPIDKVDDVCSNIISTFDRIAPFRYAEKDREKGWIEVTDRKGKLEKFPILTLSIAVIINQKRMFKHPGEMSHMMADLKKYTKTLPGSNYMIERRKKY